MFKKALAHQSNPTPIRSSARRALVTSVMATYPALGESLPTEGQDGAAGADKALGRALVPEGVRSANFETSGGVEGTFYLSPDGDALWMSFGRGSKELIPTLSLLAGPVPAFLPTLQIHHPLPPPLFTGAPLFLPAVRHMDKPYLLPDVAEGEAVALVADTEKDGNVSYVGVARVVAKGGLREALERLIKHRSEGIDRDEGKFADILCIIDDHLWQSGSKPQLLSFPLPRPRKPLVAPPQEAPPSSDPVDEAADGVAELNVDDSGATDSAVSEGTPLTPSEVSTLLSAALCQVLSSAPLSFPIPSSQLYSAHVLPSRPAYIPVARRDDVTINKSEWKKLAKWMKDASKDGLLKIKETKGEVVVTGFDAEHPSVQGHRSFLTIAEDDAKSARKAAREAAAAEPGTAASKSGGREMAIQELWRPSGVSVAFWEAAGIDPSNLNPPGLIKPTLDGYITKHKLVLGDHRTVRLDGPLAAAVGKAKEGDLLHRDEVVQRLRNSLVWSVSIKGVIKKGTLNPITMSVKTRQGRKQVTLVGGLEAFGIDYDEFAEELRRLCAGSASVQPLTGASPKLNLKEVLVQGSQCKLVTEALVARGVPKKYIKTSDGDKKRK